MTGVQTCALPICFPVTISGLQVVLKGERNGFSKLTEKEVLEIREKFIPFKYPKKQLALEYGVSVGAIKNVLLRRTWSWL